MGQGVLQYVPISRTPRVCGVFENIKHVVVHSQLGKLRGPAARIAAATKTASDRKPLQDLGHNNFVVIMKCLQFQINQSEPLHCIKPAIAANIHFKIYPFQISPSCLCSERVWEYIFIEACLVYLYNLYRHRQAYNCEISQFCSTVLTENKSMA